MGCLEVEKRTHVVWEENSISPGGGDYVWTTDIFYQVYCDNCASLSIHVVPGEDNSCLSSCILVGTLIIPPLQIIGIPLFILFLLSLLFGWDLKVNLNKEAKLYCQTCGEKWRGITGHASKINYAYDVLPEELPLYDGYGNVWEG